MPNPESWASDATIRASHVIYGPAGVPPFDAAEEFHEASKNSTFGLRSAVIGRQLLESESSMRRTASRSTTRHSQRERIPLPTPELPTLAMADAMYGRRSCRVFSGKPVTLFELSSLLLASYGLVDRGVRRRVTPSGGALYPLDVYVAVRDVQGLAAGLYHFDPFLHDLEVIRVNDDRVAEEVAKSLGDYPELALTSSAVLIVTGTFWRSRFKYALRGYRFCLIEAGHLMQNALLCASAQGLGMVPLGGFHDAGIDRLVGADGVNESSIYVAPVGRSHE